jgi:hypothetical protein
LYKIHTCLNIQISLSMEQLFEMVNIDKERVISDYEFPHLNAYNVLSVRGACTTSQVHYCVLTCISPDAGHYSTVVALSGAGIVGSNPTQDMDV